MKNKLMTQKAAYLILFLLFSAVTIISLWIMYFKEPSVADSRFQHTQAIASGVRSKSGSLYNSASVESEVDFMQKNAKEPAYIHEKGRVIRFQNGLLSVAVENSPLRELVGHISKSSGIFIALNNIGNEPVSVTFHNQPLDLGLRQILVDYDSLYRYASPQKDLEAVWVYTKGEGKFFVLVSNSESGDTNETVQVLRKQLDDKTAEIRRAAIVSLIEEHGEEYQLDLLNALEDEAEMVRASALTAAISGDVTLSHELLYDMIVNDTSAEVRGIALSVYATKYYKEESEEFQEIVYLALNDDDEDVRWQARALLDELEGANQSEQRATQDQHQSSAQ